MKEEWIDLDNQAPGPEVGLGLGEVLKYAPVIEEIIAAVNQAITAGTFSPPPIRFKVGGKHVEMDTTFKVTD